MFYFFFYKYSFVTVQQLGGRNALSVLKGYVSFEIPCWCTKYCLRQSILGFRGKVIQI